jgi:hypothetical protein
MFVDVGRSTYFWARRENMTEQEWLECTDPMPMLEFLRGKASDRKLRLFASACCRHIWHLLTDDRTRRHIEAGELYADGLLSRAALRQVEEAGRRAWMDARKRREEAGWQACWAASVGMGPPRGKDYGPDDLPAIPSLAARAVGEEKETMWVQERSLQGQYFRDIFGNPFRPVAIDLSWRTATVLSLAQAAYDERILPSGELDLDRLALLADAIEDAGCTNTDILAHCRGPGPHAQGCWVVDLLLGKE